MLVNFLESKVSFNMFTNYGKLIVDLAGCRQWFRQWMHFWMALWEELLWSRLRFSTRVLRDDAVLSTNLSSSTRLVLRKSRSSALWYALISAVWWLLTSVEPSSWPTAGGTCQNTGWTKVRLQGQAVSGLRRHFPNTWPSVGYPCISNHT